MKDADSIPTENTAEYFRLNHAMVSTKNARSAKQKSSSVNQQTVQ